MDHKNPYESLTSMGLQIPETPKPVAAYIPAKQVHDLVYISGQIPFRSGELMFTGSVPNQVSEEHAIECARQCTLNALAVLESLITDLNKVISVPKVGVFVACDHGYGNQPIIANGCSNLLVDLFGQRAQHARAAVGVSSLPLNVPVEIEFVFQVEK